MGGLRPTPHTLLDRHQQGGYSPPPCWWVSSPYEWGRAGVSGGGGPQGPTAPSGNHAPSLYPTGGPRGGPRPRGFSPSPGPGIPPHPDPLCGVWIPLPPACWGRGGGALVLRKKPTNEPKRFLKTTKSERRSPSSWADFQQSSNRGFWGKVPRGFSPPTSPLSRKDVSIFSRLREIRRAR